MIMNTFNRIFVSLTALLLLLFALIWMLLIFGVILPDDLNLPISLSENIRQFYEEDWQNRFFATSVAFGAMLISGVLFYFELREFFRREKRILISSDDLGKVEITESCIQKLVEYEAKLLDKSSTSITQILQKRDGLSLKSKIVTQDKTKISELGKQLRQNIQKKLEKNLGITTDTFNIIIE